MYHQDISAFEGTWYFENDLSAEAFIMIDGDGNWSIYQRTPGDPEATEIDCGTFSCSTDEPATYRADSSMYDGVNCILEIRFDAICYVPYSSIDDFGGELKCSVYHQLYDSYTGKWFTRIDDYKTSSRGKDYYVHTVDWNGQSGIIEFTRSSDWQSDVGEWARVVTVTYHVYLPEWYDGLVLAIEPLPDNYEDFTRFDSQHRAFAEASIMDIDLLDPYGCLFFNICD